MGSFDLQIASSSPLLYSFTAFACFPRSPTFFYAECNYPNCRHSKHRALRKGGRYRPPRITSLSSRRGADQNSSFSSTAFLVESLKRLAHTRRARVELVSPENIVNVHQSDKVQTRDTFLSRRGTLKVYNVFD